MKKLIIFNALFVVLLFYSFSFSQVKIRGSLSSSAYAWENANENQQWDFYQGLRLRLAPEKNQNVYFKTFLRLAHRGDPADWQEKVYNLYLNLRFNPKYYVRLGRQFLYQGVMNGTVDGALLSGRIASNLTAKALVGVQAPYSREFDVRGWDTGNVFGGYLSYAFPWKGKIDVSYFQKNRLKNTYWQQLGGVFSGYFNQQFHYFARIDYNLLKSDYQLMRYRLDYYSQKWYLSAEFNSSKPRIYEDSFFNIFKVDAHNQIRTAATYKLGTVDVGLQYLHTIFEENSDDRVVGTVSHRIGTLGMLYQSGYGGDNIGYFGEINYEFLPGLSAHLFNSFYNYERILTNISEDALAFSTGLRYRLKNLLVLNGEIQQTSNSYFKNDWRGLFRLTYLFKN